MGDREPPGGQADGQTLRLSGGHRLAVGRRVLLLWEKVLVPTLKSACT